MKDLYKLTFKLLMFLPFVIYILFHALILLVSGELMPVKSILKEQKTTSKLVLYGPAYSNVAPHLKLQAIIERKPHVVVLGTSRVMQFRSKFFKDGTPFYNAGGGIGQIAQLRPFLETIPGNAQPKVLIVGLDQNFFNEKWNKTGTDDIMLKLSSDIDPAVVIRTSHRKILSDWLKDKFSILNLIRSRQNYSLIGINAIENHNGFRNDGSYYYGKYISDPFSPLNDDYEFKDTFSRIAKGNRRFEYGKSISINAVEELKIFIETCKRNDIHLILFLPPFAHIIYEKMASMPEYDYLKKLTPTLQPLIESYGYEFYNFSDLASTGASDAETIDGFHASEKAYLRLFIQMSHSSPKLAQIAGDETSLREKLDSCRSEYTVFPEDEY